MKVSVYHWVRWNLKNEKKMNNDLSENMFQASKENDQEFFVSNHAIAESALLCSTVRTQGDLVTLKNRFCN